MNESPLNAPAPDDLTHQVASLRCQINVLLLALIVVTGTLATYLFYQSLILGRQLDNLEPQARILVENYNESWPKVQTIVRELIVYGQQHQDFQTILKKDGVPLTLPTATNAASAK